MKLACYKCQKCFIHTYYAVETSLRSWAIARALFHNNTGKGQLMKWTYTIQVQEILVGEVTNLAAASVLHI